MAGPSLLKAVTGVRNPVTVQNSVWLVGLRCYLTNAREICVVTGIALDRGRKLRTLAH